MSAMFLDWVDVVQGKEKKEKEISDITWVFEKVGTSLD